MEYLRSTEDLSHIEYTTLGNECSNLVVMPKRDSDLKDPGYRLHHDGINSSYPSSSETRTAYSSGFPESFTVVSSSGPKSIGNTWEYADFSARNSIIDPEDLITIGSQPLSVPEFSDMWPKIAHQHPEQPWSHIGTSNSGNDGLPRFPPDEEQHGNFWEPDPIQPQPAPLNNVSEESLSFDVLGLGMSTSASSSENLPCCSDQHTGSRINSSRRKQTKIKSAKGIQKALTDGYRQKLPMVPLSSQRASVVIPKEADSAGEHNKKGLSRHRLGSHSKTKSLSTRKKPIAKSETIHMENKVGQSSYKQEERDCEAVLPIYQDPAETDANLLSCGATASTATSPTESSTDRASAIRKPEDEFLVKSRLSGMAYKAIRQQGNFTEAESTLRGRFRTLTKHKTARVRKPEWSDNDVCYCQYSVPFPIDFRADSTSEESSPEAEPGLFKIKNPLEVGCRVHCGQWWIISFWIRHMSEEMG